MKANGQKDYIKINGFTLEIYKNEDGDLVIKQPNFYEDDSLILVGMEQVDTLVAALKTISAVKL